MHSNILFVKDFKSGKCGVGFNHKLYFIFPIIVFCNILLLTHNEKLTQINSNFVCNEWNFCKLQLFVNYDLVKRNISFLVSIIKI